MKKTGYVFIFLAVFIAFNTLAQTQAPTKWRGPYQNGFYPETGLLTEWPADGPEIIWHYDNLGEGYSSPAIAQDRIYISGMEGTTGYVYCLTIDGKFMWKAPYGEEFNTSYPGSRATPTIAGDQLYMLSGLGDLTCMSSLSGKPIWKKDIFEDLDGRSIQWGLNETLVVDGDRLYCTPGGRKHNIVALNRHDGSLIWASPGMGGESTYCTPLLTTVGTRKMLITHTEENILGLDAETGRVLWNHSHTNRYNIHPNTPLIRDNEVFCFSGYGRGGVMLALNEDGSRMTPNYKAETMDSRTGGAVVIDDRIYGSGDTNREWQCIDWDSGEVLYTTKDIGNGVVITAEGLLYLYSQRGELALVRPTENGFDIISETRVRLGSNQHWAHPVIDKGVLYVRHGNALIAYDIKR